jgi:hypothetical protein
LSFRADFAGVLITDIVVSVGKNHEASMDQAILDALSRQAKILEEIRDELADLKLMTLHSMTTDQLNSFRNSKIAETNRRMDSARSKRS